MSDDAIACRYFDGTSSRPVAAQAMAVDGALRIVGADLERTVRVDALSFVPATDRGPARIAIAGGGLCELDGADAPALFAALGFRHSPVDRLASRTRYAFAIAVAFVLVMAAAYRWGVPIAADVIVARMPSSWDRALGDRVLQTLDRQGLFKPTRLPQARRDRLVDRFDRLRLPIDRADLLIEFRRLGAPNALALPGDIIVVTDELVDAAGDDDDALLTVLAHEVGHVDHRDAMRQVVRGTLLSGLSAWYFGDVSGAAAVVAGGIGSLKFSREAEHEADLYALESMKANGISTKGAAALFRKLMTEPVADAHPDDAKGATGRKKGIRFEAPEYLSTHPATEDRIRLFETGDPTR